MCGQLWIMSLFFFMMVLIGNVVLLYFKVFVVDDDFDLVELLVFCLQFEGCKVYYVISGEDVLVLVEIFVLYVVLVDIFMFCVDGYVLVVELC